MEHEDCPHYMCRTGDDIYRCDMADNTPCVYETGDGPCETLEEMDDDTPKDNS